MTPLLQLAVTLAATCGAITSSGGYTAPGTPGTCRVIATASGQADTAIVTIASPPPTVAGIPFGASQVWGALGSSGTAGFVLAQDPAFPGEVVGRLDSARRKRVRVVLNLPAGSHERFMTNGVFDHAKYSAAVQTYNTTAIKAAIAGATADGTLLGMNAMDEPHTCGAGDGNTWGPCGTLTKARVDSLCGELKALFPSTPVGVTHQHALFDTSHDYKVCEFLIDQYKYALGSIPAYRTAALAWGARQNMAILSGANVLGGGRRDADATRNADGTWSGWDCTKEGGYLGQYAPLCQMTPAQVDSVARGYAPGTCGFRIWRWDDADLRDYQPTLAATSAFLAQLPGRSCGRG